MVVLLRSPASESWKGPGLFGTDPHSHHSYILYIKIYEKTIHESYVQMIWMVQLHTVGDRLVVHQLSTGLCLQTSSQGEEIKNQV